MADLIVISFDTPSDAEEAYKTIQKLQRDLVVELTGLALVTVDNDGKTHVHHAGPQGSVGVGATSGAFFGALLGVLFFVPVFGLVLGGAFGALLAGLEKSGINRDFRERVQTTVSQGKSAVVLYATNIIEDKFTAALAPLRGTVVQTSLSKDQEARLSQDI